MVYGIYILCAFVGVTWSFPWLAREESTLHGVVVLFRHGDRSPLSSWPNDPYFGNSALWPDGYGMLNNRGKLRQYELGRWLRRRYQNFLPIRYNRSDIYVRSTDVDRTLMSAASNLAGLYPPLDDQVWNPFIPWQPIPIHTVDYSTDYLLAYNVACPKYIRLLAELGTNEVLTKFARDNQEVLNALTEATGSTSLQVYDAAGILSALTIYRDEGLPLPTWAGKYWHQIVAMSAVTFQLPTFTPELARLETGPFFDYLFDHLYSLKSQALNGERDDDHPKFLMLSAHDLTVASVTNSMGVYNDAAPDFASTVIWELRSLNQEFFINVLFKNRTAVAEELKVPGCDFNCNLDDFRKIMDGGTVDVDTWNAECAQ
ncbi:prostatic acid phosphatase-like [Cylas formicarius]|uniref:prostatic acid phosphatase-like n=1 Tax=Cylas formicarius TaxID=197179 RepID=UPI00295850DE|nr:prostatic acid phosphatase-like [Cylas formicarius]